MNEAKNNPIGVIDSGVGGISALNALVRQLPEERFLYYGDTANAPYGTKTMTEVLRLVHETVDHLMGKGIKALVIACNTATSAAAAPLRRELTIPVIGMEPALKPAAELRKDGSILVLATPLTLQQEKFMRLMEKYGEGTVKVPCTGLMELVEKQDMAGAKLYLEKLFAGFDMDRADAVVLGCTHYVFLKDMIRAMIPAHVAITEGSDGTARQLRRVLEKNDLLRTEGPGEVVFETSGTYADLQTMKSFFQPLQATLVK